MYDYNSKRKGKSEKVKKKEKGKSETVKKKEKKKESNFRKRYQVKKVTDTGLEKGRIKKKGGETNICFTFNSFERSELERNNIVQHC